MKAYWQGLGVAGLVWISSAYPVQAQVNPTAQINLATVTQIEVSQTEQGIQLQLVTADGSSPTVFTSGSGRVLVLDVLNAEGSRQVLTDPVPGIASVILEPRTDTSMRVTVLGREDLPPAQVLAGEAGVVVALGDPLVVSEPPPAPITVEPDPTPEPTPEPVLTQPDPSQTPEVPVLELGEVIVTASRTAQDPQDVPRSVTIIDQEEIQQQATLSRDLGDILSRTVPGFSNAAPGAGNTNFQNLRGRPIQVLIDGVPIKTNLSTVQPRSLRSIDPSAVDRIEVVRGPSAIFGDGGTGGVINIITRQVEQDGLSSTLEVRGNTAASNNNFLESDSTSTFINYGLSFKEQNFDLLLNLSREDNGGFFDAEGDRIPPVFSAFDIADSETYNILGKLGFDIDANQRIQLTVNYYQQRQNSLFTDDESIDESEPGTLKARALPIPPRTYVGVPDPQDITTVFDLTYSHADILNSVLQIQFYYRNLEGFGGADDFRDNDVSPGLYTSELSREQIGARLQADTSLSETLNLVWGIDYSTETVSQFRPAIDEQLFEESEGTIVRAIGGGVFQTPPYNFSSFGIFAQTNWDVNPKLKFSGGVRYDNLTLSAADYSTFLGQPRDVEGGTVSFDDTLFNVGLVYEINDSINLFSSFSQGFSAPDFGRFLRNPPDGFTSITRDFNLASPQKVDNYEIGIRGNFPSVQFTASGFYNESEFGLGSELDPFGGGFRVTREPQRFYGLEATADYQPAVGWRIGGSLSYVEGEAQDDDGEWLAINSIEVSPLRLATYVEYQTDDGWLNRLQAFYTGNRERGFIDGSDSAPIQGFTTVDFISSIPLGGGVLSLGIENLLDEFYFPVRSQALRGRFNSFYGAARGRTIQLGYTLEW